MISPPSPELKDWISVITDIIVGVAAVFTIALGVYGLRQWKREHKGKEAFILIKNLIKESHRLSRACNAARSPIFDGERRIFTQEERIHLTNNECWKISEKEAYAKKLEKIKSACDAFSEASLEARAVLGSHIYAVFQDFNKCVSENIIAINDYLAAITDDSFIYAPYNMDKLENIRNKFLTFTDTTKHDDLLIRTMDTREAGEQALLKYLGRKHIRE